MKIAMIGHKGVPGVSGGVERHVEELGRRLALRGHRITLYNRRGYVNSRISDYEGMKLKNVFTIRSKSLEALIYSFMASIKAIKDKNDIIHYHALGPAVMSIIPRMFRKKVIVTVHGLDYQRAKWGNLARAYLKVGETVSVRHPQKTIAVSIKLKKYLDGKYTKRAGKIVYIPNGVSVKKRVRADLIRKKYGLCGSDYILFLARLVPEKGCHYLLEAYSRLSFNNNNKEISPKLVIAGGGSYTCGYIKQLMKFKSEKIIFTGEVKGKLREELYSNALFYVLPSEIEGLPISLLEAMSYGICPLVSDIDENIEVLGLPVQCGYSFRAKDADSLHAMLRLMLENLWEVKEKGRLANFRVKERYNWDMAVDATEKLYMECMQL